MNDAKEQKLIKARDEADRALVKQCDDLWITLGGVESLNSGEDVRVYASGGMWVHPCGATFQDAGRDGFDEGYGEWDCQCDLCTSLRLWLKQRTKT
jgi:hypothetical protein